VTHSTQRNSILRRGQTKYGARVGEASRALARICALLGDARDVVAERPHGPLPPDFAEKRGWTEFLASLSDRELERCEHGEPARVIAEWTDAPASLLALAARVREVIAIDRARAALDIQPLKRASERKRVQVAALASLLDGVRAERIVDFGAGHGHLTRELARAIGIPAIGVENRAHVVDNARSLTAAEERVGFALGDALEIELREGDLAVGLHACGALGDVLIDRAARVGAGVLLVSCCPQKITAPERAPSSSAGAAFGLTLPRGVLGLANLSTLAQGGIGSRAVMDRRASRHALGILLRNAGVAIAHGEETVGIHRRQLRRPIEELARRAFVHRGLAPPSSRVIEDAVHVAQAERALARRFGVPRTLLSRALELALVFDRAARLEETSEREVRVLEAFDRAASPRNVAIVRAVRA
jgi:hypothetical protein